MNTLPSVVSTAQQVVPPSWILPLSLSSPKAPCVGYAHLQGRVGPACFQLLFLEEGEGWYQNGPRKIRVRPGDLFLIAPNGLRNLSRPEGTKSWAINFNVDALALSRTTADVALRFLDELLLLSFLEPSAEIGHFQIAPADRSRWFNRLQQLEQELDDKPLGFTEAASTLLVLLLIDIARLSSRQLSKRSLQSHPLLTGVFSFIEKHYRSPISLCDVAKAVNRSPAYLTDFVRRETGRTVLGWIIERRLTEARRLLLTTNLSVERIAELVGYLGTAHFIRQFRRLHDKTPHAWRNVHQG